MKHQFLHGNDGFLIFDRAQQIEANAQTNDIEISHFTIESSPQPFEALLSFLATPSLFASQMLVSVDILVRLKKQDVSDLSHAIALLPDGYQLLFKSEQPLLPQHKTQLSAYFQFIPHWRQSKQEFKKWVREKLQQQSVQLDEPAFDFFCEQHLGNPLNAAQEIQKLYLLFESKTITFEALQKSINVNCQYEIFDFACSVISKDHQKLITVAHHLQASSVSLQLVMWALRQSFKALLCLFSGQPAQEVWRRHQIRPQYIPIFEQAKHHYNAQQCKFHIIQLAHLDKAIKSQEVRQSWQQLVSTWC